MGKKRAGKVERYIAVKSSESYKKMATDDLREHFLKQLESVLEEYEETKVGSKHDDLSDLGLTVAYNLTARARAAIERISGRESVYNRQVDQITQTPRRNDYQKLHMILGVVESLHTDIQYGYLTSVSELIHGEVFADFLEMADHLLSEGYKDSAAVVVGGTLEAHLRQLCDKNNIATEITTSSGNIRAKKADQMNADLAKDSVYSKLDQKNVTAWLDLRNKAAHGRYDEYTSDQVALLSQGVSDFITRNPA